MRMASHTCTQNVTITGVKDQEKRAFLAAAAGSLIEGLGSSNIESKRLGEPNNFQVRIPSHQSWLADQECCSPRWHPSIRRNWKLTTMFEKIRFIGKRKNPLPAIAFLIEDLVAS